MVDSASVHPDTACETQVQRGKCGKWDLSEGSSHTVDLSRIEKGVTEGTPIQVLVVQDTSPVLKKT